MDLRELIGCGFQFIKFNIFVRIQIEKTFLYSIL